MDDTLTPSTSNAPQLEPSQHATVQVSNPLGIHARPAAYLVRLAKSYQASITLTHHQHAINGKSLIAIMSANIRYHDQVIINAQGSDAEPAIKALQHAFAQQLDETLLTPYSPPPASEEHLLQQTDQQETVKQGVSAALGVAIGPAYIWRPAKLAFTEPEWVADAAAQHERLQQALSATASQLQQQIKQLNDNGQDEQAALIRVRIELLTDPNLLQQSQSHIEQGTSAEYAWYETIHHHSLQLAATNNPMLQNRIEELRGLSQQVLTQLQGVADQLQTLPSRCILITKQISPSFVAQLDPKQVIGLVACQSGATSHAALLARSMGIPTLVAINPQVLSLSDGQQVILDGNSGELHTNPSAASLTRYQQTQQQIEQQRQEALKECQLPAQTRDQHPIKVLANISNAYDAQRAEQLGADGVGLLRSEFIYLNQYNQPTEEQQAQVYIEIAQMLGSHRPLAIRTLDISDEKPLSYLPHSTERNPALGCRGIRLGLKHPSLLRHQIRAIIKASRYAQIKLLLPMVSSLPELKAVTQIIKQEAAQLYADNIEIGVMVEVPSAALLAAHLAAEVDFLSIGTNDLSQYSLAMDRASPELTAQVDALDPAILKLIQLTVAGAKSEHKRVAVCGGAASDILATPILLGLGINELSCSVATIPLIKQRIRQLKLSQCEQLAQQALVQPDAASVRALLNAFTHSLE